MNTKSYYVYAMLSICCVAAGMCEATSYAPIASGWRLQSSVEVGQSAYFQEYGSYDRDGGYIVARQWTFPEEAFGIVGADTDYVRCKFRRPTGVGEEFSVFLRVQDDQGQWSEAEEFKITVGGPECTIWYVSPGGDDELNHGRDHDHPFGDLQAALEAADQNQDDSWDSIVLAPGIYYNNIDFGGKNITIKGSDVSDWSSIADTVIHGDMRGAAVTFEGSETCGSLEGVTIAGGGLPWEPAAHWKLDESDDYVAADASGNDHVGTFHGGASWNAAGYSGYCLELDGVDDYAEALDYTGVAGNGARTVSARIRTTASSGDIISWGLANVAAARWIVRIENNYLRVEVGGGFVIGSTPITAGQWHHIAVVSDGTTTDNIKLYVDGSPDEVSSFSSQSISTDDGTLVQIGACSALQRYFTGSIDEVLVYDSALTEGNIIALASSNVISGMAAYWGFDEGAGGTAADASGHGRAAVLKGGPVLRGDGCVGGAADLDGIDDWAEICGYTGISGANGRTVSAWIKSSYYGTAEKAIVAWGDDNSPGNRWLLMLQGGTTNRGAIRVAVLGGTVVGTQNLHDGRWHHVAAVFENDGSPNVEDVTLYVDGKLEPLSMVTPHIVNTTSSSNVFVGAHYNAAARLPFKGMIDDVRIYDRALSAGGVADMAESRMVAHWRLDEASGTEARDSYGDKHGELKNMDEGSHVLGRTGNAISFDGVDDYVEIDSYRGITGKASRTVCAWVKTETSGDIVSWGNNNVSGAKWRFSVGWGPNLGKIGVMATTGYIFGSTSVNDNKWHHVAAVLENDGTPNVTEVRLYVDGKREAISSYLSEQINTSEDMFVQIGVYRTEGILSEPYSGCAWFNGLIDDVRIYNDALSGAQVRQLYAMGGGIFGNGAEGVILRCIVRDNRGVLSGGGICDFDGMIANSVLHDNCSDESGGGLFGCDGAILSSIIAQNTALVGGGMADCQGQIVNCTVVSNVSEYGGGVFDCATALNSQIKNSLFWENQPTDLAECGADASNVIFNRIGTYFNTDVSGQGNTFGNPGIDMDSGKSVHERYRLQEQSACINRGDSNEHGGVDIDFEDRCYDGSNVDIGADESDRSFVITVAGSAWADIQTAIDAARPGDIVVIPASPTPYTRLESDGDLDFGGKNIRVTSENPDDPSVVASTILDCNEKGRAFIFDSGEGRTAVLCGITIRNGNVEGDGGGIYCSGSSPTIDSCVIANCLARVFPQQMAGFGGGPYLTSSPIPMAVAPAAGGGSGGGIYCFESAGLIRNCTVQDCQAEASGGGVYCEGGDVVITFSEITGNEAMSETDWEGGGGIMCVNSGGAILNSRIHNNIASGNDGGGVFIKDGHTTISCCYICYNEASTPGAGRGGGIWVGLQSLPTSPSISNCVIYGNRAYDGGAIRVWKGTACVTNSTVTGNIATAAAGGISLDGAGVTITVANTILWGNVDANGTAASAQISGSATVSHSCVEGGVWAGQGNISEDPLLVHKGDILEGVQLRLLPGSPCIDAGDNGWLPADVFDVDGDGDTAEALPLDIAGFPRRVDDIRTADTGSGTAPIVDIGAYEYGLGVSVDAGAAQVLRWPDDDSAMLDGMVSAGDTGWVVVPWWGLSSVTHGLRILWLRFLNLASTGLSCGLLLAVRSWLLIRLRSLLRAIRCSRCRTWMRGHMGRRRPGFRFSLQAS